MSKQTKSSRHEAAPRQRLFLACALQQDEPMKAFVALCRTSENKSSQYKAIIIDCHNQRHLNPNYSSGIKVYTVFAHTRNEAFDKLKRQLRPKDRRDILGKNNIFTKQYKQVG